MKNYCKRWRICISCKEPTLEENFIVSVGQNKYWLCPTHLHNVIKNKEKYPGWSIPTWVVLTTS